MKKIEHGGALDRAMSQYGGVRSDWLDLSTGINPEPFHLPDMSSDIWNSLPDEGLLTKALNGARTYYGAAPATAIVAAPGTQALIQLMPWMKPSGEVAVVGPTYQEHEFCFAKAGWTIRHCSSLSEIPVSAGAVVIVNPNNPDGRSVDRADLLKLAEEMANRQGFLVVDEAFADMYPENSLAADAGKKGLIVLKSFGKFFGLAGLRLGFALTSPETGLFLRERLGPWAVSGPALAIAAHAFAGGEALDAFASRLQTRRKLLSEVLAAHGLMEIGGTALFSLVRHEQAHGLHDSLCRQRVLTRKFEHFADRLRFGVPLDQNDADKLHLRLTLALRAAQADWPK